MGVGLKKAGLQGRRAGGVCRRQCAGLPSNVPPSSFQKPGWGWHSKCPSRYRHMCVRLLACNVENCRHESGKGRQVVCSGPNWKAGKVKFQHGMCAHGRQGKVVYGEFLSV